MKSRFKSIVVEDFPRPGGEPPIVVYGGSFQPFHAGDYEIYKAMVGRFGKDRVFVATTGTVDKKVAPLSFKEKEFFINKIFGIPKDKIFLVEDLDRPREIVRYFDPKTPLILPVSEGEASRLVHDSRIEIYDSKAHLVGYREGAYIIQVPENEFPPASRIRNILRDDEMSDIKKMDVLRDMYGEYGDEKAFLLLRSRLNPPKIYGPPKIPVEDLLKKRITNPNTGNQILVKAALRYGKDHPAYKIAKKAMEDNTLVESILLEGDSMGHIKQPHEDPEITFMDLKKIIAKSMVGELEEATEKLGGYGIFISFVDDEIRFALDKSHLKNSGEGSMPKAQAVKWFRDRSDAGDSFYHAANDLDSAIQNMPPELVKDMFANGSKFAYIEIIHSSSDNMLPYDKDVILLHGIVAFDEDGLASHINSDAAANLARALRKVGADQQIEYDISEPNFIVFNMADTEKYRDRATQYMEMLDEFMSENGLMEDSTIRHYLTGHWSSVLDSVDWLQEDEKAALLMRWVDGNESFGQRDFKQPEKRAWFREIEKRADQINTDLIKPLEDIMIRVGADSISRVSSTIASNNPASADAAVETARNAISAIKHSEDVGKIEALEAQINYLTSAGIDDMVPAEGIVFSWGDSVYKLLGPFAPIARLARTLRVGKVHPPPEPESGQEAEVELSADSEGRDLSGTVQNPLTGNEIKISTAITYDKDHPAHRAAMDKLQQRERLS